LSLFSLSCLPFPSPAPRCYSDSPPAPFFPPQKKKVYSKLRPILIAPLFYLAPPPFSFFKAFFFFHPFRCSVPETLSTPSFSCGGTHLPVFVRDCLHSRPLPFPLDPSFSALRLPQARPEDPPRSVRASFFPLKSGLLGRPLIGVDFFPAFLLSIRADGGLRKPSFYSSPPPFCYKTGLIPEATLNPFQYLPPPPLPCL